MPGRTICTSVGLALLLSGCGGGGGPGADSAPLGDATSDDALATIDGSVVDAPPATPGSGTLTATVGGTAYTTAEALYTDYSGSAAAGSFPAFTGPSLDVTWSATSPGTSTQVGGAMRISWQQPPAGNTWWCDQYTADSSCTLEITAFGGATGDPVTGTFSGTLQRISGSDGPASFEVTGGSFALIHP